MVIEFINCEMWEIDPVALEKTVRRLEGVLKEEGADAQGVDDGFLNCVFVSDDYIQSLNKAYRDKDSATDVLSFSYREDEDYPQTQLLGEVYISVPTADRQAEELGHDRVSELRRLLAHGVLHIFGYDHETDEDHEVMSALERKVLEG